MNKGVMDFGYIRIMLGEFFSLNSYLFPKTECHTIIHSLDLGRTRRKSLVPVERGLK